MNKFIGSFEELRQKVELTKIAGTWKECGDGNQKQFRTNTGVVLNWWKSKGTLQVQGSDGSNKELFESRLSQAINNQIEPSIDAIENSTFIPSTTKKIFIVHGHDDQSLQELELFLRRLGLTPYILKNAGESGKTIIEALEQKMVSESAFGIVLMTPDDVGASQNDYQIDNTKLQPRARQNVILEMGILIGSIGRSKVAILRKGNIENPSDVNGILYISFNSSIIKEAGNAIIKHLKAAGIVIDDSKVTQALS